MHPANTKAGEHPALIMTNSMKMWEICIELAFKEMASLLRKVKSKSYSMWALLWSVFAVQSAK